MGAILLNLLFNNVPFKLGNDNYISSIRKYTENQ